MKHQIIGLILYSVFFLQAQQFMGQQALLKCPLQNPLRINRSMLQSTMQ